MLLAGAVLVGLGFGYLQRRAAKPVSESTQAAQPAPAPAAEAETPRTESIYRMEAPIEQLREFATLARMQPADADAHRVLPPNLEGQGRTIEAAYVLEAYVTAENDRWLIIMKPGDRAYAVTRQ